MFPMATGLGQTSLMLSLFKSVLNGRMVPGEVVHNTLSVHQK